MFVSVQPCLFSVALIMYHAVVYINPLQNIKSQSVCLKYSTLTSNTTLDPAQYKTRCVTFGDPANLPTDYT